MEVLNEPIIIDDELPIIKEFTIENCSYFSEIMIVFLLIIIIAIIWRFCFFNSIKIKNVEN